MAYPDPRTDAGIQQGHRIRSGEARQKIVGGHRPHIDRWRTRRDDGRYDRLERRAKLHAPPLEVEALHILRIEILPCDRSSPEKSFVSPADIERFKMIPHGRRREPPRRNDGPIRDQTPQHHRPAGFHYFAQELLRILQISSVDSSRTLRHDRNNAPAAESGDKKPVVFLFRQHRNLLQRRDEQINQLQIAAPKQFKDRGIRQLPQDLLIDGIEVYEISFGTVVEAENDVDRLQQIEVQQGFGEPLGHFDAWLQLLKRRLDAFKIRSRLTLVIK